MTAVGFLRACGGNVTMPAARIDFPFIGILSRWLLAAHISIHPINRIIAAESLQSLNYSAKSSKISQPRRPTLRVAGR